MQLSGEKAKMFIEALEQSAAEEAARKKINTNKNVLENCKETKEYLNSLPKVYIAACWAGWGVIDFPFSGRYLDQQKTIPLVWDHCDFNGEADEWHLVPISHTTSGAIAGWSFDEKMLKDYARLKNIERGEEWRNAKVEVKEEDIC